MFEYRFRSVIDAFYLYFIKSDVELNIFLAYQAEVLSSVIILFYHSGWVLQLRPGPSLLGKSVSVFTNHPEDLGEGFTRNRYRRLQWKSDSRNKGDDTALYVEVVIISAGAFHFYFTYDDGYVTISSFLLM